MFWILIMLWAKLLYIYSYHSIKLNIVSKILSPNDFFDFGNPCFINWSTFSSATSFYLKFVWVVSFSSSITLCIKFSLGIKFLAGTLLHFHWAQFIGESGSHLSSTFPVSLLQLKVVFLNCWGEYVKV